MTAIIERIVRPFQASPLPPILRVESDAVDPADLEIVEQHWGASGTDPRNYLSSIIWPPPPPPPPPPPGEPPTEIFTEIFRVTDTVRVENPDDSEQYVMVKRISQIVFSGPDLRPVIPGQDRFSQIFYEFDLTNDPK